MSDCQICNEGWGVSLTLFTDKILTLEAENKKIANEKSILTERLKEAEELLNHAYDCSFTDSKSQCSCGVIAYLDKYKIEDKAYEII